MNKKVAIITGSEGDIGKALVKKFEEVGYKVYGFDIKKGDDITKWKEIREKIFNIGKKEHYIDVLINNAGINNVENIDKESFDPYIMLNVNVVAPEFLSRCVLKYMKRGGSIINITSLWSEIAGEDNPFYGISKGGLKILTKCIARDMAKYNIRCNNVGFGYIKTSMTKNGWKNKRKEIANKTMLGRWGKPSDVVGIIAFLCSDEAKYITGQDIYVDGGWLAKGL